MAVFDALKHPLAESKTDGEIAEHCGVSRQTVINYKPAYLVKNLQDSTKPKTKTVTRKGKTYSQNTSNIGQAKKAALARLDEAEPLEAAKPDAAPVAVIQPTATPADALLKANRRIDELESERAQERERELEEDYSKEKRLEDEIQELFRERDREAWGAENRREITERYDAEIGRKQDELSEVRARITRNQKAGEMPAPR